MLQADPVALVVLLLFGVFGVVLLAVALREGYRGLRLHRERPTPAGELADASGRVLVTGVARAADRTVTAPLSGRACLACAWRISDLRTTRALDGSVRTERRDVGRGREAAPFRIEDDTGSALVDPAGADLRLSEDLIEDPVADPAERPGVFGELLEPWTSRRAREYFEARLDDGETVTVRGRIDRSGEEAGLDAGQVGVRIAGGGTLVFDALPGDAARQAFRTALLAAAGGVFALGILALVTGVVSL